LPCSIGILDILLQPSFRNIIIGHQTRSGRRIVKRFEEERRRRAKRSVHERFQPSEFEPSVDPIAMMRSPDDASAGAQGWNLVPVQIRAV
jgi:hypothetical protein